MNFEFRINNYPIQFIHLSENDVKKGKRKIKAHPERVCIECLKRGESGYRETSIWRHVKDIDGKVIRKNENGEEIWLCNKHGMTQYNILLRLKEASGKVLNTAEAEKESGPKVLESDTRFVKSDLDKLPSSENAFYCPFDYDDYLNPSS
ncbi:MAG: hypothetical protein ACK4HV_01705 [Parachlamydiaceae bacterium]